MTWTTVVLALTPTMLLLVQGTVCLMRRQQAPYVRRFGLLSILSSAIGFLIYLLLATDSLVLSPEFGLVMVQGPLALFGMVLLLMGLAIGGGMGLLVQHRRARSQHHLHWYLAGVTAVLLAGILAISRLWALNPDDSMLFRIYVYDVWWPPMLIWLSVCLSASVSTIMGFQHWTDRLWLATAFATGLALLALSRPMLGDPGSQGLWQAYLLGVLPTMMSVVGWLLQLPHGRSPAQPVLRLRRALILMPAVMGLLNGVLWLWIQQSPTTTISWPDVWLWVQGVELRTKTVTWQHVWEWSITEWLWLMTWWSWLLWLVWPVLINLVLRHRRDHGRRQRGVTWQLPPHLTSRQHILLYTVIGLALSLASFLSMVSIGRAIAFVVERVFVLAFDPTLPFRIDRTFAMVVFVIAWTILAEMIAGGPLRALFQHVTDRGLWAGVGAWVTKGSSRVASWLKRLKRRRTMSDESGKEPVGSWLKSLMSQAFNMIGVALAALVLLVVLNELPEAGKTQIQPFKVYVFPGHENPDKSESERDELGQAMSERVMHTFNRLRQVLQQEIILSLKSDEEDAEGKVNFTLIAGGDSTNSGGTAVGKSAEVEFSGIKMPLGVIASPVRYALRWLLGGRIINGSVQPDLHGYVLLANSSAGETWRIEFATDKASRAGALMPPEAVDSLANQLAFNVIGTDPTLRLLVTKSRGAFEALRDALKAWKQFEAKQDYAALSSAINRFRIATLHDAGFAFAHYRLGLALQRDGQPGAAASAFRAGLEADPGFVPGHIALASILYDFERHYHPGGAGLPPTPRQSLEVRQKSMREAHHLWQRILQFPNWAVSEPNRAAAYYGLCREASQRSRVLARTSQSDGARDGTDTDRWYYLAYYYCKQAGALYARLPAVQYAKPEIKAGEAAVFRNLGGTLARIRRTQFTGMRPSWKCWISDLEDSPYTRESLRYYAKALELLPADHRIRCHVASAAYVLGNSHLLERLDADPVYHVSLANAYQRSVKRTPSGRSSASPGQLYARAIHEYQSALRLDATNLQALVGYASTYWEWQVNRPATKYFDGPDSTVGYRAHSYALRARALVTGNLDPATAALTRAVLGRVLLAQGRSAEALEALESAHRVLHRVAELAEQQYRPTEGPTAPEIEVGGPNSMPNLATAHLMFHEISWALLQACRCVAVNGLRSEASSDRILALETQALDLMERIREHERRREFRPYTELLDRWKPLVCEFAQDSAVDKMGLLDPPEAPLAMPCRVGSVASPCAGDQEA